MYMYLWRYISGIWPCSMDRRIHFICTNVAWIQGQHQFKSMLSSQFMKLLSCLDNKLRIRYKPPFLLLELLIMRL